MGTGASAQTDSNSLDSDDWELSFEDDFEGSSLDTSNWGIGWGWGMGAPGAKLTWARERHVNVRDSHLVLTASKEDWDSDNVLYSGNVHSKNMVTVEPPVYFEAKCNFIQGAGWQNAFWSKPNDEAWPPEVDVVEYLQTDGSTSSTSHNLHYSASGQPGDGSTHQTVHGDHSGYDTQSEYPHNTFHVYGVEWREDVIRHYVDGAVVEETTDAGVLESFNRGGPEYLMLSLNLDNVGTTDKSISWDDKEYLIDWVRVWKPSGSGSGDDTGGDDTSDDQTRYLWARSGNGNAVSFEFSTSQGNVSLDESSYEADYWVADDGSSAGGTTSNTGADLPGFWFDGELTDLTYDGDLELYVDDQQVDPGQYASEDASTHYFWARSENGDPVSFEFSSTAGNIERDSSSYDADYWIADDGSSAGGTTSKTGAGLPGIWFDGELIDFTYEGPLQLYIDNERVEPSEHGRKVESGDGSDGETGDGDEDETDDGSEDETETGDGDDGDESEPADPLPRTLTIDARELVSPVSYEVSVSGEIQEAAGNSGDDSISGSTATGSVVAGTATYTFSGDLSALSVDEDAGVRIDGSPARRLAIRPSADGGDDVSYLVETDGSVLTVDGSVESDDEAAGGKILGSLTGDDSDEYWVVGGDVEDVSTFRGAVRATLSGDSLGL